MCINYNVNLSDFVEVFKPTTENVTSVGQKNNPWTQGNGELHKTILVEYATNSFSISILRLYLKLS